MKKLFVFMITALVITSCATTKTSKAVSPAGSWDYTITGTPEGDFFGVLDIATQDKNYVAKMLASGSEIPVNNFIWEAATSKVGGDFNYSGYTVYLDASMAGEAITGSVTTEGMSFPFKATRKK